jgi:hypothetical protein
MILNELIQRSPIRIFERSIRGGPKAGEIGGIMSPNGLGKTSVLVQLALDKLLQGKKVIHVSFTQHSHYVLAWYEDIFDEFISRKNLENSADIKNDLVKYRVLMNFNQDGMSKDQILKSLRALIVDGGFQAETVIIDGFDFSRAGDERCLAPVKTFAAELGLSVWYSCNIEQGQCDERNFPRVLSGCADLIDIAVILEQKHDYISLSVSKDRDSGDTTALAMRLDPKTLLILDE